MSKKDFRDWLQKQVDNAVEQVEFIDEFKFTLQDVEDTRSPEEVREEMKAIHQRLIDNYSRWISKLDEQIAQS